jgi:hypothetical protein
MNSAWRFPQQPVPLQIIPEEYRDSFTYIDFRQGVTKASSFARTEKRVVVQRPELIFALQGKMYPTMNCHGVWGEIPATEFEQLVSAIKNRILDFVLKIEAENPEAGEALPNSHPVPTEKLQPLVQNTFYGPVGNVAQNSDHFGQAASTQMQPQELTRLVTELTGHLDELNLDARQKQRAEIQIASLKSELAGDPDPEIVRQAGRSLRNITEQAIGSLLATAATNPALWQWVQHALASF